MSDIDPQTDEWSRDWRRLRMQKARNQGGVESGMLLDYLLYEGEHQSVQVQKTILTRAFRHEKDKNKLRLVINLARRLADRKVGRLWSIAHKFRATPNTRDPLAFDKADLVSESLIPFTDFKLGQDTLRWKIYAWMVQCGVCFEHCDYKEGVSQDVMPKYAEDGVTLLWKDNLTGEEITEEDVKTLMGAGMQAERFSPAEEVQPEGDLGGDVYDPFRVFIDSSVPMVKMLGPDQAIYLADIRTFDWIEDTFGSEYRGKLKSSTQDLSIIQTSMLDRGVPVSGVNLMDLLPLVRGSRGKDDPEMAIVLTRYQPASKKNPRGLRSFLVPDQCILDTGENPYPEVPVVDYHWSAPKSTMWTTGFLRDMQSLSKFINKRFSQLGEAANAQIYEMLLLGEGLKATDIPTDFPGVVTNGLTDEGLPKVQVVPRGGLPTFFPDSIRLSMETLDGMGSSDLLSQRKFPGQLRGSMTVPMLQEIIDSEDGPRFSHLGEQFAMEKLMRINRVKQFYPPIRTLNYVGQDGRSEVMEFHNEETLRAGVDFTITVDPGSLLPEMSAMREAKVRERMQWAPGLYTNPRTGQMDWSKVAKDLKYTDAQREGNEELGRKLARQLIQWARNGKLTLQMRDTPDGQQVPSLLMEDGSPFSAYPFWNHNAMMDEYEAVMQTTEFLKASPSYKQVMVTLREMHRKILSDIEAARQNSVSNQMVQGAMAQASQQAAAKAASVAAEAAIQQVMAQKEEGGGAFDGLQAQVQALMGDMQGQPGQRTAAPAFGRKRLVSQ